MMGLFLHTTFADLVVGEKVWQYEAAAESGLGVPWSAVLRYEYHIRRQAMEYVKDHGMT